MRTINPFFRFAFLVVAFVIPACSPATSPVTVDETAAPPATTIPASLAPDTNQPQPPAGTPPFNPFTDLTAEQESCLKQALGDEAFTAVTTFQRPPTPEEAQAMSACNLPKPPNGGMGGQNPPGSGQEPGGANQPGGQPQTFKDQTYVSTSADGLTWSEGVLLAEQASVPEVIYTTKSEYWAYWVDFSNFSGPNTETIGAARSSDGVNWEMMGSVEFTDLGSIAPVDPDVMELPDGRLRMYFFDIAGKQGENTIYSAVSSDGIHFTLETGSRFTQDGIYDPNVAQLPDGSYRMYLNSTDIVSASSPDGLTFAADEGVRVERGAVPGAIVLPDGSVRLYACSQGISVFASADGLNFTLEKQGAIGANQGGIVCDPSVTASPNGYLMVYKFNPGKP